MPLEVLAKEKLFRDMLCPKMAAKCTNQAKTDLKNNERRSNSPSLNYGKYINLIFSLSP